MIHRVFDRLKKAFSKGADSSESLPDTTEHLVYWRERDPHENAETTPPDTESINLDCLWGVEFYTPDHIPKLTEGFLKLGWESAGFDDPDSRDPGDWLHGRIRHARGGAWMNLGTLVPVGSESSLIGETRRVQLPTGVSYATGRIQSISPSLVGVVICFVFEEEYSKAFDGMLRKERHTYATPTRRGQRIHLPEDQKHDDIIRIRAEITRLAATWFRDNLPGEFTSGILDGEIPTCELVTVRNTEPFPDEEEQDPDTSIYLSILGLLPDFNVWRCVNTPKLRVKLGSSANPGPRHHAVAAIKEGTPLWKHELHDNEGSSPIAYMDLLLPDLLLALATQDLLEGFHRRIREVRQSTMLQDERKGVSIKVLKTLRGHLSHCADVATIASELTIDSKRRSPARVSFEPFELCSTGSITRAVSLNEAMKSIIGDSATQLQSAVQSMGDQITQFGSMLGVAENIRIQRKISVLTWGLVMLTIVLLANPLISLAIRSWGPSVITALTKLWPS